MILIQRFRKIKGQKWFKDLIFYIIIFILAISFVFVKLGERGEVVIVKEETFKKEDIEYLYVASSRGKYFYEIGSKKANSLSEKNKIYFSSSEEAKKLGFKPYFDN